MRILVLLFLSLTACADSGSHDDARSCEHQADVERVEYPDGIIRKSEVTVCTSSSGKACTYYTWTNDNSVTFSDCE